MITIEQKGDFKKTIEYVQKLKKPIKDSVLKKYGEKGVDILSKNTPVESGLTASSWRYEIKNQKGRASIDFLNSNINKGVPIAIILQYGHATKNGSWVQGKDYINPSIQPIFEEMTKEVWREATE